jgi:hypothetical protein
VDGDGQPSVGVCEPHQPGRPGTTTIAAQSNSGAARSTAFKIAGRDFVVQQASATCTYYARPDVKNDSCLAAHNKGDWHQHAGTLP